MPLTNSPGKVKRQIFLFSSKWRGHLKVKCWLINRLAHWKLGMAMASHTDETKTVGINTADVAFWFLSLFFFLTSNYNIEKRKKERKREKERVKGRGRRSLVGVDFDQREPLVWSFLLYESRITKKALRVKGQETSHAIYHSSDTAAYIYIYIYIYISFGSLM